MAAIPSFAQTNVYSVNAVGYVQQTYQPGVYQMIANPLNTTNNTIGSLLSTVPTGTTIYKWTGTSYAVAARARGVWDNPQFTLNPGEGCFINLGGTAPFTNTWVGEVMQGNLTNATAGAGYVMWSSIVPQAGDADTLGLTTNLVNGDSVYEFNSGTGSYQVWARARGVWSDPFGGNTAPPINVAQSFFLSAGGPRTWARTFSVNN